MENKQEIKILWLQIVKNWKRFGWFTRILSLLITVIAIVTLPLYMVYQLIKYTIGKLWPTK